MNAVHHATGSVARVLVVVLAILGASVLGPTTARAQELEWLPLHLSPRSNHAMAYDAARGVTVLFGGQDGGDYNGQTWEWNGIDPAWARRPAGGPLLGTYYHAMAYDANRGVTVLFSGLGPGGESGQTWEWNGTIWTQRTVSGPSWRYGHAMAFDAARGVCVLFGGRTQDALGQEFYELDDTWEWDGATWTQRATAGPAARWMHAMAYDAARGVTVLFGGVAGTTPNDETWEWNGTAWAQRIASGPSARAAHAMAYDATRGKTVLFGGWTGTGLDGQTWEWSGTTWTQRASTGPTGRSGHAMAFDAGRGRTVLFGGYHSTYEGETWEWNGAGWSRRIDAGPSPRTNHTMAYDAGRRVTVLFGGYDYDMRRVGDTWEWNGMSWARRAGTGPSPRDLHAMAYDAGRGVTVLFGGTAGTASSDETWEWNGTNWNRRTASGPSARHGHAMAYDAQRGVTVLFGGHNGSGVANAETWEWNGTAWNRRMVSGPSARYDHAMAYDAQRGVTVLFGGAGGEGLLGQTWEWNGSVWTQRAVGGPEPRYGLAMAYDAGRGASVVFGGVVYNPYGAYYYASNETWEWNGTAWTQRWIYGPARRHHHAMVYDAERGMTVLFGGQPPVDPYFQAVGDTWGLRVWCAPSVTSQPASTVVCEGDPASLTVWAAGAEPMFYQWRHGSPPADIPGATSATYSITTTTPDDAGTYECFIANTCGSITTSAATLTVNSSVPWIVTPPASRSVCVGEAVEFAVSSSGPGPLTYQWRRGTPPADIPGATGPTHAFLTTMADSGLYDCVVTNACGGVTSDPATLSVRRCCPADLDDGSGLGVPDGGTDINDLLFFLIKYEAGDLGADLDDGTGDGIPDGGVDINDLLYFLVHYEGGC